ncbi:hypothetical protein [Laceyella putida]|uniref:DUF3147 family protein n=1 Tax=Laceyella putida TaxID=110101 RepID=A0ABW2RQH7_9BACL
MAVKMLQGFGAGFTVSIVLGYIVGATGLIFHMAGPVSLMVLTYLVCGWVSGYNNEHPFVTAWLVASVLFVVNLFISINVLGELEISLLGLLFAWLFALLGAWIGKKTSSFV